jgi:hypothetical protein
MEKRRDECTSTQKRKSSAYARPSAQGVGKGGAHGGSYCADTDLLVFLDEMDVRMPFFAH